MTLRIILAFILTLAVSMTSFGAKDPDEYHAQVILANGDTITGYIHNDLKTGLKNMFSKTGSIRQYINIGDELNGGKTKRYSAKEVKEYRILNPTEGYPEGAVCASEMLNSPGMFKPLRYVKGLAWELNRRESGTVLRWDVWETTGGRNSVSRLVPAIGVRFKGAPAAFIVCVNGLFNDWYLCHYLKKNYPELHEAWDQYYHQGKDAKAHRKELTDNPSTALLFYEEFLLNNPPLNDETTD
ncbi:MAG: hypothetical protein HDS88_01655 [Bacteroidales bacterium]|nr:hypothetical protein [Bacteroidales bacterium]